MNDESPGEEIADLERAFWDNYREMKALPKTAGWKRRRLARQASKLHMHYRSHRQSRQDPPPVPDDTWILPPD